MKLSRWLILFLALLSAGLLAGAGLTILDTADQVTVQRDVLAGDPSAADGVELALPLSCGDQLFWVTAFPAGQPEEAETSFSSTLMRQSYNSPWEASPLSVEIDNYYTNYGSTWESFETQAWASTQPGEKRTYTYLLTDYLDTWPLIIRVTAKYALPDERLEELLQSYFAIPIPEGTCFTITIEKDSSGSSGSYSYDGDIPMIGSYSAVQGDRLIFALTNSYIASDGPGTDRLVTLDDSQIPGGWGVYRYTPNEAHTDGTIETCWSLPEESIILEFWGAEDGKEFFLLTQEEGQLRLRVFDEEVRLVQTLDLLAFSEAESYMQVYKGDGFFVPIVYGPRDETYCYRFAVVSQEPEGWTPAFTGDTREADALGHGSFSWTFDFRHNLDMAFDGQRLAIRDTSDSSSNPFQLAVYSQNGLEYLANYYNSASYAANSPANRSNTAPVQSSWIEPNLVRWAETSS